VLHLDLDLLNAPANLQVFTTTTDDGGFILGGDDFVGATKIGQRRAIQLATLFIGDHTTTGERGDVLQHGFAAIAEARSLDGERV